MRLKRYACALANDNDNRRVLAQDCNAYLSAFIHVLTWDQRTYGVCGVRASWCQVRTPGGKRCTAVHVALATVRAGRHAAGPRAAPPSHWGLHCTARAGVCPARLRVRFGFTGRLR